MRVFVFPFPVHTHIADSSQPTILSFYRVAQKKNWDFAFLFFISVVFWTVPIA